MLKNTIRIKRFRKTIEHRSIYKNQLYFYELAMNNLEKELRRQFQLQYTKRILLRNKFNKRRMILFT